MTHTYKNVLTLLMLSAACCIGAEAQKIILGTYNFKKDGGVYTGELVKRKPHGKGKTTYANGDAYEGEYHKGKRQGQGTFIFANGERYEGQWLQDEQHGRGTYYFLDNNKYV